MYKILNELEAAYLRDQFVCRLDVAQTRFIRLRDTNNELALLLSRTDYLKRHLRYNGAKLLSSLQPELHQAQSLSTAAGFEIVLCHSSVDFVAASPQPTATATINCHLTT